MTRTFSAIFLGEPWRNRSFKVRGICQFDVLNPCWDNRPKDRIGHHWASEPGFEVKACAACTRAATEANEIKSRFPWANAHRISDDHHDEVTAIEGQAIVRAASETARPTFLLTPTKSQMPDIPANSIG